MGIIAQHTVDGGAGALRCVPTGQGEGRRPGQRHIARRHIPIERPADIQVIAGRRGRGVYIVADQNIACAGRNAITGLITNGSVVCTCAVGSIKCVSAERGIVIGAVVTVQGRFSYAGTSIGGGGVL